MLLVDTQELGGDRVGLGRLAEALTDLHVKYKTKRLAVGDYQWLWRTKGHELVLPLLVERKRAGA